MSNKEIILIGGGGHCKSCIDVIELVGNFKIAGIIDVKAKIGQSILGYPVIGCDNDIEEISMKYDNFLITLGQIKSSEIRIKLYDKIKSLNKKLPVIISPSSYVSKHSTVGEGTIVMHQVIINSATTVGNNCIVNTKSLIEHDVVIGDHNHISTSSRINGGVKIGDSCTLGSNTTIIQDITIEDNIIIGAGAVVVKDIQQKGIYVGMPAKPI